MRRGLIVDGGRNSQYVAPLRSWPVVDFKGQRVWEWRKWAASKGSMEK